MTDILELPPPCADNHSRHSKVINILSKLAMTVEGMGSARLASAVVYKGDIISFGVNRKKTDPFQARFGKNKQSIYLHSETDAIKRALRVISQEELSKSTLYVCRVKFEDYFKKKLLFGLAEPCIGCKKAILEFGIKNVVYTLDNEGYEVL